MFMTSLATHSTIDATLFPLLTVRSCISEADESRNGARFCGQDKLTGCVYEIRSRKLLASNQELQHNKLSESMSEEDRAVVSKQQDRIDALMTASAGKSVPASVVFPADMYIQEQSSTRDIYVVCVDAFGGLSLGDIVRSGWGLVDEGGFKAILQSVESYGCVCMSLPPHGNLSPDAIKQLLVVRDGAAEVQGQSRWVVGDWLLLHDDSLAEMDANTVVGDIEWMLHSAFSQLNVSSSVDGTFLDREQIEVAINDAVDRIRDALREHLNIPSSAVGVVGPTSHHSCRNNRVMRKKSLSSPHHTAGGVGCFGDSGQADDNQQLKGINGNSNSTDGAAFADSTFLDSMAKNDVSRHRQSNTRQQEDQDDTKSADVADTLKHVRFMTLQERAAYHQNALRGEQAAANRYRRRNAPLPPRPSGGGAGGGGSVNSGSLNDYAREEGEEYELQYLTSPIKAQPSCLLTEPLEEYYEEFERNQALKARSRGRNSGGFSPLPASAIGRKGSTSTFNRDKVLEDVISLVLRGQERRSKGTREMEEERQMRREALRAVLQRHSAMEARRSMTPRGSSVTVGGSASSYTVAATAADKRDIVPSLIHPLSARVPSKSPRHYGYIRSTTPTGNTARMQLYEQQIRRPEQQQKPRKQVERDVTPQYEDSPEPRRPSGRTAMRGPPLHNTRRTAAANNSRRKITLTASGNSRKQELQQQQQRLATMDIIGVKGLGVAVQVSSSDGPPLQQRHQRSGEDGDAPVVPQQRINRGVTSTAAATGVAKVRTDMHGPSTSNTAILIPADVETEHAVPHPFPFVKPLPLAALLANQEQQRQQEQNLSLLEHTVVSGRKSPHVLGLQAQQPHTNRKRMAQTARVVPMHSIDTAVVNANVKHVGTPRPVRRDQKQVQSPTRVAPAEEHTRSCEVPERSPRVLNHFSAPTASAAAKVMTARSRHGATPRGTYPGTGTGSGATPRMIGPSVGTVTTRLREQQAQRRRAQEAKRHDEYGRETPNALLSARKAARVVKEEGVTPRMATHSEKNAKATTTCSDVVAPGSGGGGGVCGETPEVQQQAAAASSSLAYSRDLNAELAQMTPRTRSAAITAGLRKAEVHPVHEASVAISARVRYTTEEVLKNQQEHQQQPRRKDRQSSPLAVPRQQKQHQGGKPVAKRF